MDFTNVLTELGWTQDGQSKQVAEENAQATGLNNNGPYVVRDVWVKDDRMITVECNTAPEDLGGGMTAVITHPPVAVLAGPGMRVAFNPDDLELVRSLAG